MASPNNLLESLVSSQYSLSNNTLAIKYSGNRVASSSFISGEIFVWDMLSGVPIFVFQNNETTICFAFSPNSNELVSGSMWGKIKRWDLVEGILCNEGIGHYGSIVALEYLPSGNNIISAGLDMNILLWDKYLNILSIFENNFHICFAIVSPDGNNFAVSGWNNIINIWNINTKTQTTIFDKSHNLKLAFSPDSKYLASKQYYNIIKIWKLDREKIYKAYRKLSVYGNSALNWINYNLDFEKENMIRNILKEIPDEVIDLILEKIKNSYCLEYNNLLIFNE